MISDGWMIVCDGCYDFHLMSDFICRSKQCTCRGHLILCLVTSYFFDTRLNMALFPFITFPE